MADNGYGAAAAAAVTQLGNYAITAAANKKQWKYQKQAMGLQDQYNRDLWDYQNAYNTPQKQMERLQEAGLNPRLIYNNGAANMGNAGPIQGLDVPTRQATKGEMPDAMFAYLQARQMDAQYKATVQNIEIMKQRAALTETQTGLENLKLMREAARSKNYKDLAEAEVTTQKFIALRSGELFGNEKLKGNLMDQLGDMRKEQMTSLQLDNAFKQNRNELAALGIYSSDHPMFRILIQAAQRMGIDLGELAKQGYDKLKYLFE